MERPTMRMTNPTRYAAKDDMAEVRRLLTPPTQASSEPERQVSTDKTSSSSTAIDHRVDAPAIAPTRDGSAYSTRPARAFLSPCVAATIRSGDIAAGRRPSNPAAFTAR